MDAPKAETVDEKELISLYRVCKNKKYKGAVTLRFGGDGDDPRLSVDLHELRGKEALLLLANKREV